MGDVRKLIEAVGDLRGYLEGHHVVWCVIRGRDPDKYASGYSMARDKADAILRALEQEGR